MAFEYESKRLAAGPLAQLLQAVEHLLVAWHVGEPEKQEKLFSALDAACIHFDRDWYRARIYDPAERIVISKLHMELDAKLQQNPALVGQRQRLLKP